MPFIAVSEKLTKLDPKQQKFNGLTISENQISVYPVKWLDTSQMALGAWGLSLSDFKTDIVSNDIYLNVTELPLYQT